MHKDGEGTKNYQYFFTEFIQLRCGINYSRTQ